MLGDDEPKQPIGDPTNGAGTEPGGTTVSMGVGVNGG